jgi:hypothetical protein
VISLTPDDALDPRRLPDVEALPEWATVPSGAAGLFALAAEDAGGATVPPPGTPLPPDTSGLDAAETVADAAEAANARERTAAVADAVAENDRLRWDQQQPNSPQARESQFYPRTIRTYIRQKLGPLPWVRRLFPGTVTALDTAERTCTFAFAERETPLPGVAYYENTPRIGGQYVMRWPARLPDDPTISAEPRLYGRPWIKVEGNRWLYYEATASGQRIHRIPWPPLATGWEAPEISTFVLPWVGVIQGGLTNTAGPDVAYVVPGATGVNPYPPPVTLATTDLYRLSEAGMAAQHAPQPNVPGLYVWWDGTSDLDDTAGITYEVASVKTYQSHNGQYELRQQTVEGIGTCTWQEYVDNPDSPATIETRYVSGFAYRMSTDGGVTWSEVAQMPYRDVVIQRTVVIWALLGGAGEACLIIGRDTNDGAQDTDAGPMTAQRGWPGAGWAWPAVGATGPLAAWLFQECPDLTDDEIVADSRAGENIAAVSNAVLLANSALPTQYRLVIGESGGQRANVVLGANPGPQGVAVREVDKPASRTALARPAANRLRVFVPTDPTTEVVSGYTQLAADGHGALRWADFTLEGGQVTAWTELGMFKITALSHDGQDIIATNAAGATYYSVDAGATWTAMPALPSSGPQWLTFIDFE